MKYRNIEIDESEISPAGESQIEKLRSLVGRALPASFEEFMLKAGGRTIESYGFKIDPFEGTFAFPIIYSLYENFGQFFLIDKILQARKEKQLPKEVVPFACTLNGADDGEMYLDLTDDGGGRVLVFASGKPEWTGRNTEDDWLDVASSFNAYLKLLFKE